jgi:hypothetical protein
VQFESTRAGDHPGTSPPSAGTSPVRASAVQDPSLVPPSNDTSVRVVNETGARSKVRGSALKRTMSGFNGLFRAGAQLERSEAMELATVPKDGKQFLFIYFSLLCMFVIF